MNISATQEWLAIKEKASRLFGSEAIPTEKEVLELLCPLSLAKATMNDRINSNKIISDQLRDKALPLYKLTAKLNADIINQSIDMEKWHDLRIKAQKLF